ncbi:MAG: phospholipid carrier-dependent glycosyltransferase [Chloroflexi bacterium]|nr:phospholipid carrier-dependent glycosyltransferase [Chloroflexota bacterium]
MWRLIVPLLVILAGAAVQFHGLAQDVRFYPDEALFSTFARNAALNGDWLLHGSLDKTPLSIYASALSMNFVASSVQNGVLDFAPRLGEFAARLPGALASVMLTALVYMLAQHLYRRRALAAWSAIFVAFSPYTAVYGATAYTDPLMLMFAALSLLLAVRGKWFWSGFAMVLAFASKQQALYLLPLAWLLGWAANGLAIRKIAAYFAPILAGAAILIGWDSLRAQSTSLWELAAVNNTPVGLITGDQIMPRLTQWLNYGRTLVGTPTIVLAVALLFRIALETRRKIERAAEIDLLLLVYIVGYLLINWLIAFNIYPRYLLPILIPAALLAARTVIWLWAWLLPRLSQQEGVVLAAALILTLAYGARSSSETRATLSEDGRDYSGILALADTLNAQTLGAVVYDHWLGWELGYYMGQWTDKRRVYYPTPDALVSDALKLTDPAPRYFVAPIGEPIMPWLDALRSAGFAVSPFYEQQSFVVYKLIPPWGA